MKKIGIVAAMQIEANNIVSKLSNIEHKQVGRIAFTKGIYGSVEVVIVVSGVGKVNATLTTQILIDNFRVEYVINTGIAGSLNESVKHLDVVVADKLTYHDFLADFMIRFSPNTQYFECDTHLISCVDNQNFKRGLIVTGDSFVSSSSMKNKILSQFPNALCVEMEGAAIAHACYINNVPFVVLRCISDSADDNADGDYNNFEQIAADKASVIILNALCKI